MTSTESAEENTDSGESQQRDISLSDAYSIGRRIEYLTQGARNEYPAENIAEAMQGLEDILEEAGARDSFLESLSSKKNELQEKSDNKKEDEEGVCYNSYNLEQRFVRWYDYFGRSMGNQHVISVTDRGLFNVSQAMKNPSQLFGRETWKELPERPKNDIREACSSLAVECPTAAVMLSLRAVEDRLRAWYEQKTDKRLDQAWGRVLDELEDEFEDESNPPAILSNLDYLREKRNEVNHPEKSPSWQEAETTLYMVRGTINEIHELMNKE